MTTPLPSHIASAIATGTTTLAYALRLERTDGQAFGFTSADIPFTAGGVTYDAEQGLEVSAIVTALGLGVDNLELSTADDGSLFILQEVIHGVWANASFLLFRYDWTAPELAYDPLMAGTTGNVTVRNGQVTVELRGLQQYLQQPVGSVTSKTCRARFADYPSPNGGNLCRLVVGDWTASLTVASVSGSRTFVSGSGGSSAVDDYYGGGVLTWTSGSNVGLQSLVKSHSASRVFELQAELPYTIGVGDGFDIVAGCRKRRTEDCAGKFSNVLNFQGEPDAPMVDALTASPGAVS